MAMFPVIQSPCPYKRNLAAVMDGDFCRMCKRNVTDLTGMSDNDRRAFLNACAGETCVSYRLPVKRVAAAALTVAAFSLPQAAAAQDATSVVDASSFFDASYNSELDEIIVGGIRDPKRAVFLDDQAIAGQHDVPVIFEDEPIAKN